MVQFMGTFKGASQEAVHGTPVKNWELMQMQCCLKMADISHPSREWLRHSEWTQRCMTEFFNQGDLEKEQGLPVSAFMDRADTNVAESQKGFINVLVQPLFDMWRATNYDLGNTQHIPSALPHAPTHLPRSMSHSAAILSLSQAGQ